MIAGAREDHTMTADLQDEMKKLLYANGYLFVRSERASAPGGWVRTKFAGHALIHEPRLKLTLAEDAATGVRIAALGHLCDVRQSLRGVPAVLEALAALPDEATFLAETDWLCGRFVLIVERAGRITVVGDATGNRQIHYHRPSGTVASHPGLIRRNVPDLVSSGLKIVGRGAPAHHTAYRDVYLLTPNMVLDLPEGTVRRFWPRAPIPQQTSQAAAEEMSRYMRAAMVNLMLHYRVRVSLTGGLDSRTTAAICHDMPTVRFFNYYRSDEIDSDRGDREFFDWFAGWTDHPTEHHDAPSSIIPKEFAEVLKRNTVQRCISRMAWYWYRHWRDQPDLVHVRSNLSEVGRAVLARSGAKMTCARDMAEIYLQPNKSHLVRDMITTMDQFEHWAETVSFFEAAEKVDALALFQWEFRMATWYGNVVAESDVAVETIALYNCRKLLEAMLSVSRKEQLGSMVQRRLIAMNWPRLTTYRVNGKPFWPDGVPEDLAAR